MPRDGTETAYGLSFDLRWTGSTPAYEEPRQFQRMHGRWWGTRDRSWGVRPVGEPEPAGIRTEGQMQGFWNYAPMQFEDHSILYMVNEHDDGTRVIEESVRIHNDPARQPEPLGRPEHEDWRFGMYQGPEVTQCVEVDHERDEDRLFGLVDQVGRFTQHGGANDAAVGHGLHEFFFVDTFNRYGLTGWDPAVADQWT